MNKEQQAKISHLEKLVADLVGRLMTIEDKDKKTGTTTTTSRTTRSTQMSAQPSAQVQEHEERLAKF